MEDVGFAKEATFFYSQSQVVMDRKKMSNPDAKFAIAFLDAAWPSGYRQ